jgi:hypothetical protein
MLLLLLLLLLLVLHKQLVILQPQCCSGTYTLVLLLRSPGVSLRRASAGAQSQPASSSTAVITMCRAETSMTRLGNWCSLQQTLQVGRRDPGRVNSRCMIQCFMVEIDACASPDHDDKLSAE